jgi:hypothetical protein
LFCAARYYFKVKREQPSQRFDNAGGRRMSPRLREGEARATPSSPTRDCFFLVPAQRACSQIGATSAGSIGLEGFETEVT